ncbi:MAG TPA: hypothetical protein VMT11_06620 [Myxococcaceae bacterium]|nr:hypothetical protein [Myxococcaceae bacterium]
MRVHAMQSVRGTTPLLLAGCLLASSVVSAETVVARRRMGNNTESITYDPKRDRVLAIDGNDVIAIALNPFDEAVLATSRDDAGGISGIGFRKIFDVTGFPQVARAPRGLVYVPTQDRFYFSSVNAGVSALFSTDYRGRVLPELDIHGLASPEDIQEWEGLAWIPPGSPAHPGTIAALAVRGDFISHVFFVRLDGTLEAEVVPQPGTPLEGFFCGVQYWPRKPGTVLLSNCEGGGIWAMDMQTGALVGDPSRPVLPNPMRPDEDVEGIVVRTNGEILVNTYEAGRLFAYDTHLLRNPQGDRLFTIGAGASILRLGWNYDSQELIAAGFKRTYAMPLDLRSARVLFDVDVNREVPFPNGGMAYLGGNLVAIGQRAPDPGIDVAQLDPTLGLGFSLSRLRFSPLQPPALAITGVGAYGPDRFLVRVRADGNALKVFSRSGTPDSSVYLDGVIPTQFPDLPLSSPTVGFEAQVFDAGAGTRIFTGTDLYDGNGVLVHHIDVSKLGITHPPLVNGVWISGNLFAAVDGQTSTVIVYTVP